MTESAKTETVKTDRDKTASDRATTGSDRVPPNPALPLTGRDLTRAEQRENKAAQEEERLRQKALNTVHEAPPDEPENPPVQPAMVPARQIPGDVAAAPRRPLDTADANRPPAQRLRVRATKIGYYDDKLQRVGDVFDIAGPDAFSRHWMERVAERTPKRTTTKAPELQPKAAAHAPIGGPPQREEDATGDREVLGE